MTSVTAAAARERHNLDMKQLMKNRDCGAGAQVFDVQPECLRIPEWPKFAKWLTENAHGMTATLERWDEHGNNSILVRERPFAALLARALENGVCALTVAFDFPPNTTLLDLAGPHGLMVQRNPSGFTTQVDIEYAEGRAVLYFTCAPPPRQQFTGNSWGE